MPLLPPASAGHEPDGAGEDFVSDLDPVEGEDEDEDEDEDEESPPEEPLVVDDDPGAAVRESVR